MHGPLRTVHSNTLGPIANPVTVVFGFVGSVMLGLPALEINVHIPFAGNITSLPSSVALVIGVHKS